LDQPPREVIEESRMARRLAGAAEVVDGAHDPAADQVMPHAIGEDARDELAGARVDVGEPTRELDSSALLRGDRDRCLAEDARESAGDDVAGAIELAGDADALVARLLDVGRN